MLLEFGVLFLVALFTLYTYSTMLLLLLAPFTIFVMLGLLLSGVSETGDN